jgi:hypothetical protein
MNEAIKESLTTALTDYCRDGMFPDEAADAAILALRQWLADEGLTVVPREATEAMSDAFYHSLSHGYPDHRRERQSENRGWAMQSHFVWDTFIAAAPDALDTKQGEG